HARHALASDRQPIEHRAEHPIYAPMNIPSPPRGSPPMRMDSSPLDAFHPALAGWFRQRFRAPTAAQAAATGSGKTLTAFLAAIDALVREGVAHGGVLADATSVVYVSPLKALSNDI